MPFDPSTVLTQAELTIHRTPKELNEWLYAKLDYLSKMKEAREWVLLREGLSKNLHEEVYPLNLFTRHLYGDRQDIECVYRLGQDDFDALIVDHSTAPAAELKVEITQAVDGYDSYLRMKYFVEHRHVSLTGPVSRKGTKNTGQQIYNRTECVSSPDKVSYTCSLIRRAIERKSVATNGHRKYGMGHVLLVWFDDSMFRETERAEVQNFVEQVLTEIQINFRTLFVVGVPEGETFLQFSPGLWPQPN